MKRMAWFSLVLAAAGCLSWLTYAFDPQEFAYDFGTQAGTLPDVSCAADASACSAAAISSLPAGATASCDDSTKKCVATYDLRLVHPVALSQQSGFPESAVSAALSTVKVDEVRYWTVANTLTVASPEIEIWVGSHAVQKETDPGARKLGTIAPLAAMVRTACKPGAPGSKESACEVMLTDDGKDALELLVRDYKSTFNVIVVAHGVIRSGQPIPGGNIDLFVQPVIGFGTP